ncbi:hypothetical protein CEW92_08555 [Bacillaceae bacterium SAS-127]|nr:hypothetical protein CEW92_08555 [Bacillaceae bacterium SAS-127]
MSDKKISKRLQIIEVALQLFMEKGYEHTTINDILRKAEVSKGGMYHYFQSKEEILDVVIHHIIDEDLARFETILQDDSLSAVEKFQHLFIQSEAKPEDIVKIAEQSMQRTDSLFHYRSLELSKARTIPVIVRVIEQGITEGEMKTDYPEEMAEICYTLTNTLLAEASDGMSDEAYERRVAAFLHVISHSLQISMEPLSPIKESMLRLLAVKKEISR